MAPPTTLTAPLPDPTPSPTTAFRCRASNRAVHVWDVSSGSLAWCGKTEEFWREFRPPPTIDGWFKAIHPNDFGGVERAYRRLAEDRLPVRVECRVRRPDGRTIAVSAHLVSLSPQTVVACLTRDYKVKPVAEPPPAKDTDGETTIPPYDPTYERFFDQCNDLLCVADLDGRFVRLNRAFVTLLGHPMGELLKHPFAEYVHPDDHAGTRDTMAKLSRGEAVVQFRNRYRTAGGEYLWLEWNAQTAPAERRVYAVARDVTERVRLRRQLEEQTARERAILDSTGALVYVKGADGRYQFVNAEWERVCNLPDGVAIGRTDAELFPPEFAARFVANDERVLRGEEFRGIEEAPTPAGRRTFTSVKVPLRDADGTVVALAGVSTDVTDRLRAEADLRIAQDFQRRLYPAAAPTVPGFEIAGRHRSAAQLCGDYYDYVTRPDGRLVLAAGDVEGHGVGSALAMIETRAALRVLLDGPNPLPAVAHALNRHLYGGLAVTLFLGELDPPARTVRWVGAGHDAHLFRAGGGYVQLNSTSSPLAWLAALNQEDPPPPVRLEPGDVLVLFTDGLNEAQCPHGRQFTTDRLLAAVPRHAHRPAAEVIDRVFAEVVDHLGGGAPQDDMTMVVVKVG